MTPVTEHEVTDYQAGYGDATVDYGIAEKRVLMDRLAKAKASSDAYSAGYVAGYAMAADAVVAANMFRDFGPHVTPRRKRR